MQSFSHSVLTPEEVELSFERAGVGSRFIAMSVDMLIQAVVFFILFFASEGISGGYSSPALSWYTAFLIISAALLFYVYFFIFEGVMRGRTPGKAAAGIRVIKINGQPVDFAGVLVRNLFRLLDFLPLFYGVGAVMCFINRSERRVGDVVAGTVVVRDRVRKRARLADIERHASDAQHPAAACRYPLDAREFELVGGFCRRAMNLPPKERYLLAREIAGKLYDKFYIPPEGRWDDMRFIWELYEMNKG